MRELNDRLVPFNDVSGKATRRPRPYLATTAALVLASIVAGAALDARAEGWVSTWTASPQRVWGPEFPLPLKIPATLTNQTLRQVARVSLGGSKVRVLLSNEYGTKPLVIGAAHVGLAGAEGAVTAGSDRALTFGGKPSVTIPPGAPVLSDPVDLTVPALGSVAVSVFLPEQSELTTIHWDGEQTAYISPEGNVAAEAEFKPASTMLSRVFLSGILVDAPAGGSAIITFGDSITDGADSTPDTNQRWPDILAQRLQSAGKKVAVLNQGISGDRVLRDRMGDNALARFERDVLSEPKATTVITLIGINDIGWPGLPIAPGEPAPSADDVIAGYQQLIARAHAHGLKIIGATLTPFQDAFKGKPLEGYWTAEKEQKRQAINNWIRTSGAYDGVIDFDAMARDPKEPTRIRADFDCGDHLHPNDAGYKAMAEGVDLNLLTISTQ